MELQGKIIVVCPIRKGTSAKGTEWQSQDFVVSYLSGQYDKKALFNIFGADKIQKANLAVGNVVKVSFDTEAKEHNGRWFGSLNAWNIYTVGQQATPQQYAPIPPASPEQQKVMPQAAPEAAPGEDPPF